MIGHAFILGQNEQSGASFSLSCAAQSFPAPTFRYSSKNTKFCLKKKKKKKKKKKIQLNTSSLASFDSLLVDLGPSVQAVVQMVQPTAQKHVTVKKKC